MVYFREQLITHRRCLHVLTSTLLNAQLKSHIYSPNGIPCVRLTIGETRITVDAVEPMAQKETTVEAEPTTVESTADDVAAAEPSDPLPYIKEVRASPFPFSFNPLSKMLLLLCSLTCSLRVFGHLSIFHSTYFQQLLQMFDSMLDQSWTAVIRSEMRTFRSMSINKQKKQNDSYAKRVAGQLSALVEKVPVELRERLLQLNPHQFTELILSDWLEQIVEEKINTVKELSSSDEVRSELHCIDFRNILS